MDYQYEQVSEVEALDSIYYGDMQSNFSVFVSMAFYLIIILRFTAKYF